MHTRKKVLAWLDAPDVARHETGCFLAFLMIPVAERFGQWRFAGAASNLADAFAQIESLARAFGGAVGREGGPFVLREFARLPDRYPAAW